jgi:hypothetical protein
MMDFISLPVIVGIITLGIYKLFELFARRKERLNIIEKMDNNFNCNAELLQKNYLTPSTSDSAYSTLKVACLLLAVGLGLLVGFFIVLYGINDIMLQDSFAAKETKSIIYGASVLFFGGLGLLIAFIMEQRYEKKKQ